MIKALIREADMQSGYLGDQEVRTIYFGGGTPSALPADDIRDILQAIRNKFLISPDVEITLESNPDDINNDLLTEWKSMGINRLSIGIQAFQEELLKAWNRSHSSLQAKEAIALSQRAGFENITADLMYGGTGLTDEDWIENIQTLIESGIPHISSYALTVESGTALAFQIEKRIVKPPDDEQSSRQYALLQSYLSDAGFDQYEVSNFAKPGWQSRHNTSYWSGLHYLGLGPSAHSFNGFSRQWNISNNIQYITAVQDGVIPVEKEILSASQQFNELVMTGLRTSHGIDMVRVNVLGEKFAKYLGEAVSRHSEQMVKNEHGNWVLKPAYYFFADGIAADLFLTP